MASLDIACSGPLSVSSVVPPKFGAAATNDAASKRERQQARRKRRIVKFEESVTHDTAILLGSAAKKEASCLRAGDGWKANLSTSASALTKNEARAFAQSVLNTSSSRDGLAEVAQRPWAVRGEVPYEDPRVRCTCVDVIQGGVRMKLPEKLFARNFLELTFSNDAKESEESEDGSESSHPLTISVDAAGALCRWASLSLDMLDDRRSGRTAWSGWSLGEDRFALARSWRDKASPWAKASGFTHREEWEWTYRTDYVPTCVSRAFGTCEQTRARWDRTGPSRCSSSSGILLPPKLSLPRGTAKVATTTPAVKMINRDGTCCLADGISFLNEQSKGTDEDMAHLTWEDDSSDDGSDASTASFVEMWRATAGAPLKNTGRLAANREFKLFEDYLDELGLAACTVRLRCRQHGWELRIRWWAVVNPGCVEMRGRPCCRLRDTTLHALNGEGFLTKNVEERYLSLIPEVPGATGGGDLGHPSTSSASLDADSMAPQMPLLGNARPRRQRLYFRQQSKDARLMMPSSMPELSTGDATDPLASFRATCAVKQGSNQHGCVAVGSGETGELAVLREGSALWRSDPHQISNTGHAGVESLAFLPGDGYDGNDGVLLSAGSDGHVRAWDSIDGGVLGECKITGAVGADSEYRGLPVVSCIASARMHPHLAVAAAGRSVILLSFCTDGTKLNPTLASDAAAILAPLSSVVTALSFGGVSGGGNGGGLGGSRSGVLHLCACTTAAGVFIWEDINYERLSSRPFPSRRLDCGGSCISVMAREGATQQGSSASFFVVTGCVDRTLRVWPISRDADISSGAGEAVKEQSFTFGGFASKLRGGTFDFLTDASTGPIAAVADGRNGAVVWHLGGARLDPEAHGIDSRRALRLCPPQRDCCVLAVALSRGNYGTPRLACTCVGGSAFVFEMSAENERWVLLHSCGMEAICLEDTEALGGVFNATGFASTELCGEWLYWTSWNGTIRAYHLG